jgi:heme/copper-type cytochrome/quinol oxidase subunit 2
MLPKKQVVFLIAAAVLLVLGPSLAVACPTCTEGMASDPAHASLVRGYFWSIIFMMSMPFLILGSLSSYFYYEVRRARHRLAVG